MRHGIPWWGAFWKWLKEELKHFTFVSTQGVKNKKISDLLQEYYDEFENLVREGEIVIEGKG